MKILWTERTTHWGGGTLAAVKLTTREAAKLGLPSEKRKHDLLGIYITKLYPDLAKKLNVKTDMFAVVT